MRDFKSHFDAFFAAYCQLSAEYYEENYPAQKPELGFDDNRKYVRVWSQHHLNGGKTVLCFVDKTNGNVLKAKSWKAPAKHARSNVYDDDHGISGVGVHGARYLR